LLIPAVFLDKHGWLSSLLCLLLQLIDGRQSLCRVRCLRLASVPSTLQTTLVSSSDFCTLSIVQKGQERKRKGCACWFQSNEKPSSARCDLSHRDPYTAATLSQCCLAITASAILHTCCTTRHPTAHPSICLYNKVCIFSRPAQSSGPHVSHFTKADDYQIQIPACTRSVQAQLRGGSAHDVQCIGSQFSAVQHCIRRISGLKMLGVDLKLCMHRLP